MYLASSRRWVGLFLLNLLNLPTLRVNSLFGARIWLDLGTEEGLEKVQHLAWLGVAADVFLGKDCLPVDCEVEDALAAGD